MGGGQVPPPTPQAGAESFQGETSDCVWPGLVLRGQGSDGGGGDGPEGGPWGLTSGLPPDTPIQTGRGDINEQRLELQGRRKAFSLFISR